MHLFPIRLVNVLLAGKNLYFSKPQTKPQTTFVQFIFAAKDRYPDRVFLLLGNRDVNKVRFLRELAPPLPSLPLDNIPAAMESKQFPSVRSFLLNLARSQVRPSRIFLFASCCILRCVLEQMQTQLKHMQTQLTSAAGCSRQRR
jgi:hypothetical protein